MPVGQLGRRMNGEEQATRDERTIAGLSLSPHRRKLRGPGGEVSLEPLVVQLLLLLAEADGEVVPRRTIFERLWGAAQVGDDSLNRVAASLRRALTEASGGAVGIETVPRAGYRLTGSVGQAPASRWSRRQLIGGGVAATAAIAAIGWFGARSRSDDRFEDLVGRGEQILRYGVPLDQPKAVVLLERALHLEPEDPRALGLLAYALADGATSAPNRDAGQAVRTAERAVRDALAIDPDEPNARLALLLLQGSELEWLETDRRLREILRTDPDNTLAMGSLGTLLQSAGLVGESAQVNERMIALDPVSPLPRYRRSLLLWIQGRVGEADREIDKALQLWPNHPWVWNARFLIFAFTGRPRAAWAMLENAETRPKMVTASVLAQWEPTLLAMENPNPARRTAATLANLKAAREAPGQAAYAVMSLSSLGEVDAAYEVVNGFLLARGSVITRTPSAREGVLVGSPQWRRTNWLFTPPTAPLRRDARFAGLSADVGLAEYWRQRRVRPEMV